MVQASDKQSREAHEETRGSITERPWKIGAYVESKEKQTVKGWYWCSYKRAFFRFSDWNKPISDFV